MASYQISAPERFDCANSEEWPRWIRRFERFRTASGLTDKSEESQVNTQEPARNKSKKCTGLVIHPEYVGLLDYEQINNFKFVALSFPDSLLCQTAMISEVKFFTGKN